MRCKLKQSCLREQRFQWSRSGKLRATLGLQEAAVRGSPEPMKVQFREVDTFSLWIWFELHQSPSDDDLELLDAVLSSWFMIGRLGGFNAMNLQAMYVGDESVSFMKYEHEHTESALQAVFHDMGSVENQGKWCRCWFDLGTSDELALDVLINALLNFSRENVGIKQCIIGGVNADWPIPSMQADSEV
ncbi:g2880 [Coccomyxa elongata]